MPEIASIGLTEEEAKKEGLPVKASRIVMGSNAKSLIADEGGYILKSAYFISMLRQEKPN